MTMGAAAARVAVVPAPFGAMVCRSAHFTAGWYDRWRLEIARGAFPLTRLPEDARPVWAPVWTGMKGRFQHRKLWEWCAIAEALDRAGMLAPGRRGCGFAVGFEPLTSLAAARGATVLATDIGDAVAPGWAATGQQAAALDDICWPRLIDPATFRRRVSFTPADMRAPETLPAGAFDFLWSSCALEHLGSLEAGADYVVRAMALLRPGGVAVHTTEFNVASESETLETGDNVLYRRSDIEALGRRLAAAGCVMDAPDFTCGDDPADRDADSWPFYTHGRQHVKLVLGGFVSTSILLIARKPAR